MNGIRRQPPLLYWDNAATTWPKPPTVRQAVGEVMVRCGGNPGRVGHHLGMASAEMIYDCREAVAGFFGLSDPSGVVFMHNCTTALNTVIHGVLASGGHAVISDLEHNAVWRPLHGMGCRYDIAAYSPDPEETVANFRRAIRPDTRLLVCTHASNVFGVTLPIRRLAALAHDYGLVICVDAAQTAGVLPINMEEDDIDYLCIAAHKGLYAPMGTGLLICRCRRPLTPLVRGGTGSSSLLPTQPDSLPDGLESGTPNTCGIAGVLAGVRYVECVGRQQIYAHEMDLLGHLYDGFTHIPQIRLLTPRPKLGESAPVLSVQVVGHTSEHVAAILDEYGVAVRAGLHCAPLAHRHFGTLPGGTVRFSPSTFSSVEEVEKILQISKKFG